MYLHSNKSQNIEVVSSKIKNELFQVAVLFQLKTKGKKHSSSKTKTIAPVDVEKLNSIQEFIAYAVTENRMEQAIVEVFAEEEPTIQKMGDFLRWLVKDIAEEEVDVLEENGLIVKDIGRYIANKARPWFQALLDKQAGL